MNPTHAPLLSIMRRMVEDQMQTVMCDTCGDLLDARAAESHDCPMIDEEGDLRMRQAWQRILEPPGLARTKGYAVR